MNTSPSIDFQLRLVGVSAFGAMAAMRACDPMLLKLSGEFSRSVGETSHVISAFAIAYGLLQLVYGPLGDRCGKLRVVSLASTGCAVACALVAMAPTLDRLVAGRVLMGAAAAGVIPLTMAWIGDNIPYERRQEILARLLTATVSGMIAGQWFGAWITEHIGWRWVFWALMLLFALAAWPLHVSTRRTTATPAASTIAATASNPLVLLRQSRVRWVVSVTAVEGALVFGPLAFVPSHLTNHFGLSTSQAGAVLALYGLGGLIYARSARRWVTVLGERGLAILGGTALGLSMLVLAWASHWLFALPACLLAGTGFYMMHATLQVQASQMAPARRGAAMSLFSSALFFGQSLGVVLTALAIDHGFASTVLSVTATALICLGALIGRGVEPRVIEAISVPR